MPLDVIEQIRLNQKLALVPESLTPPDHKPEILLIGCVDARLNPKNDIGIPDGKALFYRNIAALVGGKSSAGERVSEAAALEFAVNIMKVKHIAVMGHTDCGGIKACLQGVHDEHTQQIRRYLAPLEDARKDVVEHGGDMAAQARAMEEAAVRQSIANLMSYDVVRDAVREGRLQLHGWVINTGTHRLSEMDHETGKFSPMALNSPGKYANGPTGQFSR